MRPDCRIRPASAPAVSPNPQKKSARTPPAIAPPVSCATISRFRGSAVFGHVVAGMDVVDKIKMVETTTKGPFENVPVNPVIIKKATLEK